MGKAVFSAPADARQVVPQLRNLQARLGDFRPITSLNGEGTTDARLAALESAVNKILSKLKAVTG